MSKVQKADKPAYIHRIGISLLLVNTDEPGDDSVTETIFQIFDRYKEKNQERLGTQSISSELYTPIELELFGTFDKLFVFLQDDNELINQYLHPQSTLLSNATNNQGKEVLFRYKTITGSFSERTDTPLKKAEFLTRKFEKIQELEDQKNASVVFLSRIKIGTPHLIKGGGKLLDAVKEALKNLKNKDPKYRKYCKSFILIESFGFHELVLLSSWEHFTEGVTFLKEAREMLPDDIKALLNTESRSIDDSLFFELSEPIFDLFSSSLAFKEKIEHFKDKDHIEFHSVFGIRPGGTKTFREAIRNTFSRFEEPNIQLLLGWKDYMVDQIFSGKYDYKKEIAPFFEEASQIQIVDNRETVVSMDFNAIEQYLDGHSHLSKTRGADYAKADFGNSQALRERFLIRQETIIRFDRELRSIGINQAVIQRGLNAISNFNKSILDRENFTYFHSLYNYIHHNLIRFSSTHHILISEEWQEDSGPEADHLFFSVEHIEEELIKIIKGFETAFSNRYIHSRELSEISDTNYAYRGGIQQYLLIFEYLLSSYHKRIFYTDNSSVSLYVTGYSKTTSTLYNMRMNIFQVYNPGLFLVILSHEVVIHIFHKIIMAGFLDKVQATPSKNSKKFLKSIGCDDQEYLLDVLKLANQYSKIEKNPFYKDLNKFYGDRLISQKDDQGGVHDHNHHHETEIAVYYFTDLITLEITFLGNKDIFIYWHLIYFFQLFGVRPSRDRRYTEELVSFLLRLYLIFKHENPDSPQQVRSKFKAIITKHLRNVDNLDSLMDVIFDEYKKLYIEGKPFKVAHSLSNHMTSKFERPDIQPEKRETAQFNHITDDSIFDGKGNIDKGSEFMIQRKIGFTYLSDIHSRFNNIFIEKRGRLFDPKKYRNESALIVGQNGGISFNSSADKEEGIDRIEVFEARMNFYQRLWHLCQKSKTNILDPL